MLRAMTTRPRLDLEAARERTIPDVLPEPGAPFLVLFCGINPGLYSAATGWHFARPGNRFWPALHLSGFTPRRLAPSEQDLLPGLGLGITNLVARATAQASELHSTELRAGREHLATLVDRHRPRIVAIAWRHRLPHRVRPAARRDRTAAGPARPRPGLGPAQSQRPQRSYISTFAGPGDAELAGGAGGVGASGRLACRPRCHWRPVASKRCPRGRTGVQPEVARPERTLVPGRDRRRVLGRPSGRRYRLRAAPGGGPGSDFPRDPGPPGAAVPNQLPAV